MAGGTGSRLWPLSRTLSPKQFMIVENNSSMLQATLKRLDGFDCAPPIIITNEEHRFIVAEQMRLMGEQAGAIILEPVGRNTAPAVALAAFAAIERDQESLLMVMAADHIIGDMESFHATMAKAKEIARQGKLVTFGIPPKSAETGYGYIRAKDFEDKKTASAFQIAEFVEKPNAETAEKYLESGAYFWNSGMFMFQAKKYLEELEKFRPDIFTVCKDAMRNTAKDMDFLRVDKHIFTACPSDSIDYAVMEKTDQGYVIPLDVPWNDIGSWSALWDIAVKDDENNVLKGDVLIENTSDSYIQSTDKLVAVVGLDNVVVVNTKDAVLVSTKNHVQKVKNIVEKLKSEGRSEHLIHREVYRPWGKYDSIDMGERYQVKRITVKPGAKLSMQMHHHRAEHWIIVSGTAKVHKDGDTLLLSENESVYIPLGTTHSLENPGKIPLELIEVQSGPYLGEDDIIRFEDVYGRV